MSVTDWALAIDFGTSNTAAAHTNPIHGAVEAVNLSNDQRSMTSSVYVDSPDQISTGPVALSRAQANPNGYIPAPKRLIGQDVVSINGYEVETVDIVAAIYRDAIERAARAHNGTAPGTLLLTHPDAWSEYEVTVLTQAAIRAGIRPKDIVTISEPRAAAAYYTRNNALAAGSKIAVFDIGGGTVDIAVLEASNSGKFTVLAADGNNTIGGRSFDAAIRRWVDQELGYVNPDLLDYLRRDAKLRELHALETSIREAKELLSDVPSATIPVHGGLHEERLQLTRDELNELISAPLNRAINLTEQTLRRGGINSPDDLVALYLTGGSSRVPALHEALKNIAPIATLDDPKTVVAQGALIALQQAQKHPGTTGSNQKTAPKNPTPDTTTPATQPASQKHYFSTPAPASQPVKSAAPQNRTKPKAEDKPKTQVETQRANGKKAESKTGKKRSRLLLRIFGAVLVIALVLAVLGWYSTSIKNDNAKEVAMRSQLADYPQGALEMVKLSSCSDSYYASGYGCYPNKETQKTYGLDAIKWIRFEKISVSDYPWEYISDFLDEQSLISSSTDTRDMPLSDTDSYSINPSGTAITVINGAGDLKYYQEDGDLSITALDFPSPILAQKWAEDAGIWWD